MAISMQEADYVGVHHITKEEARESFRVHGSGVKQRGAAIPWTHLRLRANGRAALYLSARAAVRVLVKALWLFPILLVPKLVLRVMGAWYGDLITVAFVILVVVTFGSLSLLSLLHLLAGSKSERDASATLELDLPRALPLPVAAATLELPEVDRATSEELTQLARTGAQPGAALIRLCGTIDAGLARGEPVLTERWVDDGGVVMRVVSGLSFALQVEAGPLVAVELAASPVLLGPYRDDELDGLPPADTWTEAVKPWLPAGTRPPELSHAPACILRQGDMVEVLATSANAIADSSELRLGGREPRFARGEGGPYRGERTAALLLRCLPNAPLLISSDRMTG